MHSKKGVAGSLVQVVELPALQVQGPEFKFHTVIQERKVDVH
jgi:hypothetical protein